MNSSGKYQAISQNLNQIKMQHSLITTTSATVGGLTKAFILGFSQPAVITLPQLAEVAIYAAISASIGYSVKLIFDIIKAKLKIRIRKQIKEKE
jgi:uncharacterized membrane protein YagU involved in acid resistance